VTDVATEFMCMFDSLLISSLCLIPGSVCTTKSLCIFIFDKSVEIMVTKCATLDVRLKDRISSVRLTRTAHASVTLQYNLVHAICGKYAGAVL